MTQNELLLLVSPALYGGSVCLAMVIASAIHEWLAVRKRGMKFDHETVVFSAVLWPLMILIGIAMMIAWCCIRIGRWLAGFNTSADAAEEAAAKAREARGGDEGTSMEHVL